MPPLITGYPQNGSAPCDSYSTAYPAWLANQIAPFAATDASGIQSLTNNAPANFPPGCKEPLTVRFKAVDNVMFQLNVDVIFSTSDNQGPVVVKAAKRYRSLLLSKRQRDSSNFGNGSIKRHIPRPLIPARPP